MRKKRRQVTFFLSLSRISEKVAVGVIVVIESLENAEIFD